MIILHAAETVRGGPATVLRSLVEHQVSLSGNRVIALLPEQHHADVGESHERASFRRTGRNISSFIRFVLAFTVVIVKDRPNVVHLHSTFAGLFGRVILLMFCPIFRPKVIYCPHGWSFMMNSISAKRIAYFHVEKLLLRFCSFVICVSQFEKDLAIGYGMPEQKLTVIRNGVARPPRDLVAESAKWSDTLLRVIFVGRLDNEKGFGDLVASLKFINRPMKLTVIGDFVKGEGALPLDPRISYLGWLPHEELSSHYQSNHVCVVPSHWEAFGLSALEGMANGLAVVATNNTALPELVADGWNGYLYEVRNSQALGNILNSVEISQLEEMGARGRQAYEREMTDEHSALATYALYERSA